MLFHYFLFRANKQFLEGMYSIWNKLSQNLSIHWNAANFILSVCENLNIFQWEQDLLLNT